MADRVRVFIACSLDGFIAGPDDDLSWLPSGDGQDFGYAAFMADVGALLMGRRSYEVVAGFPGEWPYGALPVLVATHRSLQPKVPTVRPVAGTIEAVIAAAREAAAGKDIYIDGGALIREALEAGQVDELCVSVIPVALGRGVPLFAGLSRYQPLELVASKQFDGGLLQLTYRPSHTGG